MPRAWLALAVTGFAAATNHLGEDGAALRVRRLAGLLRANRDAFCSFDGGFGLLTASSVDAAAALAHDLRASEAGRSLSVVVGWGAAWQAEGLWAGAELDRIRRAAPSAAGKVELTECAREQWGSPAGFGVFEAPAHRSKALGFRLFVVEDYR